MSFLDCIRRVDKQISTSKKITNTFAILIFGIALGVASKFFDTTASNELPFIVQYLDIRNFLGRFSIWVLIALCISLYSHSPFRAAINVFLFFLGMITSYYLYSAFIAGFFPASYAMIWFGFTVISPLLAFVCWYGKRCGFSKRYFLALVACRHLTCTKTECRKMFLSLIAPLTTIRLNRGKRSNRLPYIFAQGQER